MQETILKIGRQYPSHPVSTPTVNIKIFLPPFLPVCNILYSTLLHLPPLKFNCVGGCWDWTCRTLATWTLVVVRWSNHSTILYLIISFDLDEDQIVWKSLHFLRFLIKLFKLYQNCCIYERFKVLSNKLSAVFQQSLPEQWTYRKKGNKV